MSDDFKARIQKDLPKNPILLFVKGTKESPQCGFSAQVIEIFKRLGRPFETRDVLSDPELRQGMKDFSQWPTFPQVYVNGEFIGGCDIIVEMYRSGELEKLMQS